MANNLPTTKANTALALEKAKSRLDIVNKLLNSEKNLNDMKNVLSWLNSLEIPEYYNVPINEKELTGVAYLRLDSGEHADLGINYLPIGICHLSNLKRLELCSNNLSHLPKCFGRLQKLKILYLDYNNLNYLPKSFSNLKLTELYIRYNNFNKFPNEISNITSLKTLALTGIKRTLSKDFINLYNLEELFLGCNDLIDIPEVVMKLDKLRFLSLRNNNLRKLHDNIINCKSLKEIILSNNPNLVLSKKQIQWIKNIRQQGGYVNLDLHIEKIYNISQKKKGCETFYDEDEIPF